MMAGGRAASPTVRQRQGLVSGLRHKMILGAGLLLATLGGLVVWAGTAAIDRRAFESMRQRGAVLARLLALACGGSVDRARAGGLTPPLDGGTGAGGLGYVRIVGRG